MPPKSSQPQEELRQEQLRRYGLDCHPHEQHERELERADRLAEQASLSDPVGAARALARFQLGRGPNPYAERDTASPGDRLVVGEEVVCASPDGDRRRGELVASDGELALVDFGGAGQTVVECERLDREAV